MRSENLLGSLVLALARATPAFGGAQPAVARAGRPGLLSALRRDSRAFTGGRPRPDRSVRSRAANDAPIQTAAERARLLATWAFTMATAERVAQGEERDDAREREATYAAAAAQLQDPRVRQQLGDWADAPSVRRLAARYLEEARLQERECTGRRLALRWSFVGGLGTLLMLVGIALTVVSGSLANGVVAVGSILVLLVAVRALADGVVAERDRRARPSAREAQARSYARRRRTRHRHDR